MQEHLYTKGVVKIGVIAYAPKVVAIWEGIKGYLHGHSFNADWILYSAGFQEGRKKGIKN